MCMEKFHHRQRKHFIKSVYIRRVQIDRRLIALGKTDLLSEWYGLVRFVFLSLLCVDIPIFRDNWPSDGSLLKFLKELIPPSSGFVTDPRWNSRQKAERKTGILKFVTTSSHHRNLRADCLKCWDPPWSLTGIYSPSIITYTFIYRPSVWSYMYKFSVSVCVWPPLRSSDQCSWL
jgi:hypothetical protein